MIENNRNYYNKRYFGGLRYIVLERDNYKCIKCEKHTTTVHHKDCDASNNTLKNLESLCTSCHRKEHLSNRLNFSKKTIENRAKKIRHLYRMGIKIDKIPLFFTKIDKNEILGTLRIPL